MSARFFTVGLVALALLAACDSEPEPSRTPTESTSPDRSVDDEVLLAALKEPGSQTVSSAVARSDVALRDPRAVR